MSYLTNLHANPIFKTLLHFLEIAGLYVASTVLTQLLNDSSHWGIPPQYAIVVPILVMAIQTALKSVNAAKTQLAATNALSAVIVATDPPINPKGISPTEEVLVRLQREVPNAKDSS